MTSNRIEPISDSPLFWVTVFVAFGIVGLVVIGPRYEPRQLRLERKSQGHQRAAQIAAGKEPTVPVSTANNLRITLAPLIGLLSVVLVVSWVALVRQRTRLRQKADLSPQQE